MSKAKGKKLIIPNVRRGSIDGSNLVLVPTTEMLLDETLSIIGVEIAGLKSRQSRGAGLTDEDAKNLQDYVKSIINISKENRELAKLDDYDDLSDQELIKMIRNSALKEGNKPLVKALNAAIDQGFGDSETDKPKGDKSE